MKDKHYEQLRAQGGIIDKAYVSAPGDASVGIFPTDATVEGMGVDLHGYDESDWDSVIAEVRKVLVECFSSIWDEGSISVTFDFEERV